MQLNVAWAARMAALTVVVCCPVGATGEAEAAKRYVCQAGVACDSGSSHGAGTSYGSIQAAVDAAACGDTIYVRAGETFVGEVRLTNTVDCGSARIVIRSDAPDSAFPGAGVRAVPLVRADGEPVSGNVDTAKMPTLVSDSTSHSAIVTATSAQDYVLRFLRFLGNPHGNSGIIEFGNNRNPATFSDGQQFASQQPQDMTVDRCIFEPHHLVGQKVGIILHGSNLRVENSYLANMVGRGQDAACISGANGSGPLFMINNYCEGGGYGYMNGGDDPQMRTFVKTKAGSTTTTIQLDAATFRPGHSLATLDVGQHVAVQVGTNAREHTYAATKVDADTFTVSPPLTIAPAAGLDVRWGEVTQGITIERNYFYNPDKWRNPIVPSPTGVAATPLTGSGSLAATTHYYVVTARKTESYQGNTVESPNSTQVTCTLSATGRCQISWNAVNGASHYRIWGRSNGGQNLYFEVAAPATTFTDTGGAGTSGTPPGSSGPRWQLKNHVEIKHGTDVTIRYNVLDNKWSGTGGTNAGIPFWLKSNDQNGNASFNQTKNVLVAYNVIKNSEGCFTLTSKEATSGLAAPGYLEDVTIEHNLCFNSSSSTNTYSVSVGYAGPKNFIFRNNTILSTHSSGNSGAWAFGNTDKPWKGDNRIDDSIFIHNSYGFKGDGLSSGSPSLNTWLLGDAQDSFAHNVVTVSAHSYPATTLRPQQSELEAAFVDYGGDEITDYDFVSGHPWRTGSSTGGRIGADIPALNGFVAGVEQGGGSPSNLSPTATVTEPTDGAHVIEGADVTVSATAADSDGSVSSVEFFAGTTSLGADATAPYSVVWGNVGAGTYQITARATDNAGATGTSAPITLHVDTTSGGCALPVADNFNDNAFDAAKWVEGPLPGGSQDAAVDVREVNAQLEIGPLVNASGNHYNGARSSCSYPFTEAAAHVELVQSAGGSTTTYTMFSVGENNGDFYRWAVSASQLSVWRGLGGTKVEVATLTYDPLAHRFLRIRHDAGGDVVFETAPGNAGVPGAWVIRHREAWNTSVIPLSGVYFELKAGVGGVNSPAPGTAIFDNFSASAAGSPPTTEEVVRHAADMAVTPGWRPVTDATAASGLKLVVPDDGLMWGPMERPRAQFETTFTAPAGVRYRLWLRLRAADNYHGHDSVWVQFSDSVDQAGAPVYQIGSASALAVELRECSSCPLSGWGWRNSAFWAADTGDVWFGSSGPHTLRVLVREDGVEIDQIVLSPAQYLTTPPGSATNDSTIVPRVGSNAPPTIALTAPADGASFAAGAAVTVQATASDDGSVSRVDFYANGVLLGSDLSSPYSYTWSAPPAGTHLMSAVAADAAGATTAAAAVSITAAAPPLTDTVLLSDDFASDVIAAHWTDTFSDVQDPAIPVAAGPRIDIGGVPQPDTARRFAGIATAGAHDFFAAYASVELRQPMSSLTTALAAFSIGSDAGNRYEVGVVGERLTVTRYVAGTATTLQDLDYDAVAHRFLRVRHEPSAQLAIIETAPAYGHQPGAWTERHSEPWHAAIELAAIRAELKAGTDAPQVEPTWKGIFDNFLMARTAGQAPIGNEVVIRAADVAGAPGWKHTSESTAAGGVMLASPDQGLMWSASAAPRTYFEVPFRAWANRRYRVWVRMRALNNYHGHDAVFLQFSSSINQGGTPIYRIGSNEGLLVRLQDCAGCPLNGWGWQNGAYDLPDTGDLWFGSSGDQTLRVSVHEDGVQIDQVVISSEDYLDAAPGSATGDGTVVPLPDSNQRPSATLTAPLDGASAAAGATITLQASASDSDGSVTRVDFYVNGEWIATDTASPYQAAWSSATGGTYALSAVSTDDAGGKTSSLTSTVTVTPPSTTEVVLLGDDFNDGTLSAATWNVGTTFTGPTEATIPLNEAGGTFQIGVLPMDDSDGAANGISSASAVNFIGAYAQVELVQPAYGTSNASTTFTVGVAGTSYRLSVRFGSLVVQKEVGGQLTDLQQFVYDATQDRFLRIRHDAAADAVVFETAPGNGGIPGDWTDLYSEPWASELSPSSVRFELKAGVPGVESVPPLKAWFDNFKVARP